MKLYLICSWPTREIAVRTDERMASWQFVRLTGRPPEEGLALVEYDMATGLQKTLAVGGGGTWTLVEPKTS